jgi:phospholipid/cholesterol/gamma-HCH transport system permease protein
MEDFGQMLFFFVETLAWALRPPYRPELVLSQMAFIGVGSMFIVGVTGTFTGMVLSLQFGYAMK